ncbi:MAG: CbtA family protein [Actinophytocola sp.]|uniref:CbtA family protein n=1 Tax=Actinophytocola sp. TaxID=1872138 RepID=UPI003C75CA36
MTARNFLIRGLLAGLFAGLITFVVANVFGEPAVDAAIAVEEAGAADAAHDHADDGAAAQPHDDDGTEVSRATQKTFGLGTATIAVGTALGGLVGLVSAATVGRIRRLTPAQSTGLVALAGFVSVALVPFLKYPATPPAVGNEDTIGSRTGLYFLYLLISVVAAALAVALGRYLSDRLRIVEAVTLAVAAYLVVVVGIGHLLPTVNEIGEFPGDTLWYFRRASLITLATLWAAIGVVLSALVGRLHERETAAARRRDLAANL